MFSQRTTTPRLVLWHHDLAWTTPRYLPELYNGFPWDLLRTDWPKARQVVVSELRRTELAELTGLQPGQIHVVPNGLDFADFLKLNGQTIRLIKRLKLLDIHPLLILPVRITRRKNIELALRVLGHLCKGFPEAGLIVTGPLGPHNPANQQYRAELTALRSSLQLVDRAFFLSELIDDYLPYSVVVDFYRLADALLMPSREEGFGIPILESGLAGVPVFCTDIPALRELAGDQASYFLPDSDPEQIAAMIRNQLSASPVYHLRTRVRTQFSWEHIYTEHIEPWLC
jgi:glycosyltransferase involved in cell wall biosynthesis